MSRPEEIVGFFRFLGGTGEFPVVFCGKIRYDGKKAGIRSGEAGMQMKGKRRIKWVYVAVDVLLIIPYLCRISGACPSLSRQPDMLQAAGTNPCCFFPERPI